MNMNRREMDDRRQAVRTPLPYMIDRRKLPDRRLGGLVVRDVQLNERAFSGVFAKFITKIK